MHGFWHPDPPPHGVYWVVPVDPVPDAVRQRHPEGTVEVPLRPDPDHVWDPDADIWVHAPQPAPVPATIRPVQWRIALITAAQHLGWAEGKDLAALVEAHLASLPESAQVIARARLEYGDPIVSADILAFWEGVEAVQGITRPQIEELLRLAVTL
jgi:hypothetical protein